MKLDDQEREQLIRGQYPADPYHQVFLLILDELRAINKKLSSIGTKITGDLM